MTIIHNCSSSLPRAASISTYSSGTKESCNNDVWGKAVMKCNGRTLLIDIEPSMSAGVLLKSIEHAFQLSPESYYITRYGKLVKNNDVKGSFSESGDTFEITSRLVGGIDFQHREGSKIGSGGMLSESSAALERKERLRKLALETIDITKDPYFMKNHLGGFECKLCLTLHPNEGSYLSHTQGKKHQSNLGKRAAYEAKNAAPKAIAVQKEEKVKMIKIGRPGYKVTKSRDLRTRQRCLRFDLDYPDAPEGCQPRHRFMSAYEQKVETPDKDYQYLLFACEPYETVAFKLPSHPVDKGEGKFVTNWDPIAKKFVLTMYFVDSA